MVRPKTKKKAKWNKVRCPYCNKIMMLDWLQVSGRVCGGCDRKIMLRTINKQLSEVSE